MELTQSIYKQMTLITKSDQIEYYWHKNAVIAKWNSFFIEKDHFEKQVFQVFDFIKNKNCKCWIADASSSQSVFKNETKNLIENVILRNLAKQGVEFFLSISPENAFARATEMWYINLAKKFNLQHRSFHSLSDAVNFTQEIC